MNGGFGFVGNEKGECFLALPRGSLHGHTTKILNEIL